MSNRIFVVVTRFEGKTWYHIRESAEDKCVILMKDELSALFLNPDGSKETGVHLKNAEVVRATAQTNDDSLDRAKKGNNKRRRNVSIEDKTSTKRGIKRKRSTQNIAGMQSKSNSDDSDNHGSITTQRANGDYWESD